MPSVAGSLGGLVNLAFTPLIPASCLAFMTFGPSELVQRFINPEAIARLLRIRDGRLPLAILTALGLIRTANRALNRAALNNWSFSARPGWQWSSEIALVTGGSSGIGKCLVLGLVDKGVRVVVVLDIIHLPPDLAALGEDKVRFFRCDLTKPEEIRAAAEQVRSTVGHPSIVINNAGVGGMMPILETSDAFLDRSAAVNQQALWRTTREFLPSMLRANKGHIVTMASTGSYVSIPTSAPYAATKAAALAFMESLRSEIMDLHKTPGVLTSVVYPAWVRTEMTAALEERVLKSQGGRPMMTPQEAAAPVLEQIFSGRGGQVFIPGYFSFATILRAGPDWIYALLQRHVGATFYDAKYLKSH